MPLFKSGFAPPPPLFKSEIQVIYYSPLVCQAGCLRTPWRPSCLAPACCRGQHPSELTHGRSWHRWLQRGGCLMRWLHGCHQSDGDWTKYRNKERKYSFTISFHSSNKTFIIKYKCSRQNYRWKVGNILLELFIKNLKQCLKQLGVEMNIKVCPKLQKSLRLTDFGYISYKM